MVVLFSFKPSGKGSLNHPKAPDALWVLKMGSFEGPLGGPGSSLEGPGPCIGVMSRAGAQVDLEALLQTAGG